MANKELYFVIEAGDKKHFVTPPDEDGSIWPNPLNVTLIRAYNATDAMAEYCLLRSYPSKRHLMAIPALSGVAMTIETEMRIKKAD